MSNLEMTVEALKRCVSPEAFEKAMNEVRSSQPSVKEAPHLMTAKAVTRRIHEILNDLGMPTNVKGYRLNVRAIEIAVTDPNIAEDITKGLYCAVAEEFGSTPSRVERAIRHAIEITWDRGDISALFDYFGNSVSAQKGKPTNSEFITRLATKIRVEMDG